MVKMERCGASLDHRFRDGCIKISPTYENLVDMEGNLSFIIKFLRNSKIVNNAQPSGFV